MLNRHIRGFGYALLTLLLVLSHAGAADLEKITQRGVIEIAVYAKLPPYSYTSAGQLKGVDVEIGRALAGKLGFSPTFRPFLADESVEDDFRNQIWKGHYLGGGTADVMMHVPADPEFAQRNDQVRILAPYYQEEIVVARSQRLKDVRTLDAFVDDKVGVEKLTLSSYFLLTAYGGGMRESAAHFKTYSAAVDALRQGEVAAVLGPRGEIEGALGKDVDKFYLGPMPMPGLHNTHWDLGLAVKSDHEDLAAAIEKAMSELRKDGTIAQIFADEGLTYRAPSMSDESNVGLQAALRPDTYKGPACR